MKPVDSPAMPPSPDRALVRFVLVVLAIIGFLGSLLVGLLRLMSSRLAGSSLRSVRCLITPVSSLDIALHSTTVIIATACVLVVVSGFRAFRQEWILSADLRWATRAARLLPSPRVAHVARVSGTAGHMDIIDAQRPFAFVHGWLNPRICLSTGLITRLTDEELTAVLFHEDWHRRRRDPVRLLLVRTLLAPFVLLPLVRRLAREVYLATEIAADRYAIEQMRHRRWLASALLKTIDIAGPQLPFPDFAEARILALGGEGAARQTGRSVGRAAAALLVFEAALVAMVVAWGGVPAASLTAVVHPVC